jgi:predicted RNA-binding Zn-ribbon protein involved in translation (DUF1610 family)
VAGAKQPIYYQLHGAHIEPIDNLAWQNWSLHELLAATDVQPDLPELRSPGEYVNRLTGWINRLNEIRERLKCRVCGETMIPNYAYARNLARYNATVVSCQQGVGHNQNVYLNHCWACGSIIDSRDTPHTAGGLYICGACGSAPYTLKHFGDSSDSGFVDDTEFRFEAFRAVTPLVPRDGHNAQTYAQGDICPRCGEPGMTFSGARIHRVCRVCKHKLETPSLSKRTGPRCRYCRKGPATLASKNGGDPERICISCGKSQETPNMSLTLSKRTTLDTDRTAIYDPAVDPPIEAYNDDTDWS